MARGTHGKVPLGQPAHVRLVERIPAASGPHHRLCGLTAVRNSSSRKPLSVGEEEQRLLEALDDADEVAASVWRSAASRAAPTMYDASFFNAARYETQSASR